MPFLASFLICTHLWAAQDAIVVVERAVIFADEIMSSPIGFVSRGKKVRIGEKSRNKSQVFPIVVSGKIGFIKASDLEMGQGVEDQKSFMMERFQNYTKETPIETTFTLATFNYNSQVLLTSTNGEIEDKDNISWSGFSLRGNGVVREAWEFQVITNYLSFVGNTEELKFVEAGLGGGYRFLNFKNFYARIETQFLFVPWASYAVSDDFRVNGQGYSFGVGLSLALKITKSFGIECYGGSYYTQLGGFEVPRPYSSIEPVMYGTRLGAGIYYAF